MPTSFSPRNIFDTHGPATINSNKEDSSSSSGGGGGSGLPPSPMQFLPNYHFLNG